MKVFLSYRRDDTGGRAGRLYDALAQKYGQQRVFQDVSSATPGLDFTARIESTIADSDAVLVVIGPNWLSSSVDAGRRIDQHDDFVRREVSAALATDKPVVPVLVDGAALPRTDELPTEMADLVNRQAVTLRDTSWHQDVDGLIRQLEGEGQRLIGNRRRKYVIAGVTVVALVATTFIVRAVMDDGSEDDSSGETPICPDIDGTFIALESSEAPPTEWVVAPNQGEVEVVAAWWRYAGGNEYEVIVRVKVTNTTDSVEGTTDDEKYFGVGDFESLRVNGAPQGEVVCVGDEPNGDPQIKPGANVTNNYGFVSLTDPSAVEIELLVLDQILEVTS